MKKISYCFSIIILIISLVSCATDNAEHYEYVQNAQFGNYEAAYLGLLDNSKTVYSSNDEVLKNLDLGILSHYANYNKDSLKYLEKAEKLIYKYYSKSFTQNLSSFLINDNVIDYAGESYEDIYVNLFKALSYIEMEDYENAFVEIKRFDTKQKELSVKYSEQIERAKEESKSNRYSKGSVTFHNSAFARYLSMLLYLSEGDDSSAMIDYNLINDAFKTQSNLYNFDIPKSIEKNFNIPEGKARLNVVAFSGLSPIKIEKSFYEPLFELYVALPEMQRNQSKVSRIELYVIDENNMQVAKKVFSHLESISNIAIDTFKQKQILTYYKAIARATTKKVSNALIDGITEEQSSDELYLLWSVIGTVSKVSSIATEQADIRTSRYFPSDVYVADTYVTPGIYKIQVCYYGTENQLIGVTQKENFIVSNDKVNLLEAVCLK